LAETLTARRVLAERKLLPKWLEQVEQMAPSTQYLLAVVTFQVSSHIVSVLGTVTTLIGRIWPVCTQPHGMYS
jgi:hypothetical protein